MIVKNEAERLARVLQSVQGAVEEIIVVDTGSTDETVEIANQCGVTVLSEPWEHDFAKARNAGLKKATGRWILFMDADEELDKGDVAELHACATHEEYDGFFLQVHNYVRMDGTSATVNPILRMFKNHPQYRFEGAIHEQIATSITRYHPAARFHVTSVKIHHYGYTQEIMLEKDKHSRNMSLLQVELQRDPNHPFYLYNIAVEHLRGGAVQEAYEAFHQSRVLLSPETSYTHLVLKCEARCLAMLGKMRDAVVLCQEGIQWYRDYTDLHHYQSSFLSSLGLVERAKIAAVQAIQIGRPPMHYHTEDGMGVYLTWYHLGMLNEATHDYEIAINCYVEAMRLRSGFDTPLYRIFRILRCLAKESEIERLLAEKFVVQSPEAWLKVLSILFDTECYASINGIVSCLALDQGGTLTTATIVTLRHLAQCLNGCVTPDMCDSTDLDMDANDLSFRIRVAYAHGRLAEVLQRTDVFRTSIATISESAPEHAEMVRTFVHCMSSLADKHLTALSVPSHNPILQDLRLQLPGKSGH